MINLINRDISVLTKKQYVISKGKLQIDGMQEIKLEIGLFLYVGKDLCIRRVKDANGRNYLILGNVYICDKENKTVESYVSEYEGDGIDNLIFSWTGKFLILGDKEIQLDACGLMPLFYTEDEDWCMSSSIALLKLIKDIRCSNKVSKNGLNWHFMPNTICDGVKALLCTQKIMINGNVKNVIFNPWIKDLRYLSTDEKIRDISKILKISLSNIYKYSEKNIWIALTAGKDSRLVLASALSAGIKFNTFTFEHASISSCDKNLPGKISKELSFNHVFCKRGPFSQNSYDLYERFNSGNSRGADQMFYSYGQFDKIPPSSVIIRSGIFEAGQKYARRIAGPDIKSFREGVLKYYESNFKNNNQLLSFETWLNYIIKNPINFIDIRDRMYIEQRVGGWVSAIEQSLDLLDCESIQVANSRIMLSILLSASDEERNTLALSYQTINKINPQLARYPYNKVSYIDKLKLVRKLLCRKNWLNHFFKKSF